MNKCLRMGIIKILILANVLLVSSDLIKPKDIKEEPCTGCSVFPNLPSYGNFSNFATILELNTSIAIGTKNAVVFMSKQGEFLYDVPVMSTNGAMKRCILKGKPELCFIMVDFIIKESTGVIACGKISGERNCWKIQENNSVSIPARKYGSYYRKEEFAHLNTGTSLFIAFQGEQRYGKLWKLSEAVYYKLTFPGPKPTYPRFVSIYEFGEYIYYFFQEYQEDVLRSDKVTYSRVGRLCKYDKGSKASLPYHKVLTLFSKARLLCEKSRDPLSKDSTTQYNILQKTSFVKEKDGKVYIYGLFKSSNPMLRLSVVCRFSLANIDKTFETTKYYSNEESVITVKPRDPKDPRYALKCNASLDTTVLGVNDFTLAATTPLAVDSVKADGDNPVLILENTRISHITSESVDTSIGEASHHLLHLLASNILFNAVVPRDLTGNANVFFKQRISKDSLEVLDFKYIQGVNVVASVSNVVIIPVAVCHMYKTCRQCIQARNPQCGWYNSTCGKFSRKSQYKQDIQNGDFSKLCEKEGAKCDLSFDSSPIPNKELVFCCKHTGVPRTVFTTLKRNDVDVDLTSDKFDVKQMANEAIVVIKHYNIEDAGNYTCHVNNTWSTTTCSKTLPGSVPRLKCRVSKQDSWYLTCSVTGYPQPTIHYQILDGNTGLQGNQMVGNRTEVLENNTYQFYAYNAFGADVGKPYKLFSQSFEFAINKTWNDDYADTKSPAYKTLKSTVLKEIRKLYPDNMRVDVNNVEFRKGSCVASFQITSLTTSPSDVDQPIMAAIKNGMMGDLTVYEYKPVPTEDHQSTYKPLTTPSTQPSYPRSPHSTTPPRSSSNPPFSTTHLDPTEGTTPHVHQGVRSSSSGVSNTTFGVTLALLLVVIIILVVIIGVIFDVHRYFYKKFCPQRSDHSASSDQDDEELPDMKRTAKERESQRNLLDGKKERRGSPDDKNKKSHSPTIGSREAKSNQSVC